MITLPVRICSFLSLGALSALLGDRGERPDTAQRPSTPVARKFLHGRCVICRTETRRVSQKRRDNPALFTAAQRFDIMHILFWLRDRSRPLIKHERTSRCRCWFPWNRAFIEFIESQLFERLKLYRVMKQL